MVSIFLAQNTLATLLFLINASISDVRIRKLVEEKNELSDQLRRLKLDLEEEKTKSYTLRERNLTPLITTSIGTVEVGDLQSESYQISRSDQ